METLITPVHQIYMQHLQPLSRVKKTPDFIGRNRRAVRNAGRERGKETGPLKAPGQRRREKASDTVEISKSYLNKLLQMCLAPQQSVALDTTSATTDTKLPTAPGPTGHITTDLNRGPRPCPAPNADGLSNRRSEQAAAALSPQEQWLSDLAQQRTEQIAKREEEKLRKRTEDPPEEYFPWGRPGGGAPIRTVSGTLLTNYSTRGQAVEDMRNTLQHSLEGRAPRRSVENMRNTLQHSMEGRAPWSPEHAPPPHNISEHAPPPHKISEHAPPPHKISEHAPPPHKISPHKSQFARGMGPHVDTFVLSHREEQRRKDLIHKEQLEAQISERHRQREAERLKQELEEREAELRVRREIDEINKRNERERERQRHKAEQERVWQAMLQAQIEEAEEAARREKLAQREQDRAKRELPSRIPLPIKTAHRPPHITHVSRADDHRAAALHQPLPQQQAHQSINQRLHAQAPSPPLPAVARAMAGRLSPSLQHSHISHHPPPQPATSPPPQRPPISPIVPALAKKLASQTISQPPLPSTTHHTSPPLPALACRPQPHSTQRHSPSLPIHHPPSNQPLAHSSLPPLPLPNLTPSQQHTGMKFPTQPPDMGARQQTILHQLAILREGILSQRNAVDTRLQQNFKLTPTNPLPDTNYYV